MRNVLFLALILMAPIAPAAAAQQTPPPATTTPPTLPPPGPGRAPGASRPGATTPTTTPPSMTAPALAPPAGQTPRPGSAPAASATTAVVSGTWQNVRLDVTISDSLTADVQTKKSVSMLILDGREGHVRSMNEGNINIDASPTVRPDGRIYLRLTVEYQPFLTAQQAQQAGNNVGRTQFSESLIVIVTDGKPIMLSQAADPRGDRKVSLEVTATVIK